MDANERNPKVVAFVDAVGSIIITVVFALVIGPIVYALIVTTNNGDVVRSTLLFMLLVSLTTIYTYVLRAWQRS